ncbi:hypothetical protein VNO77_21217 [Canavalia gladiata]|uniref:Uncharacterized protein n=1 Tax=Canavalia gladiata TaxID=3824 RepID=A0AAN9LRK2_CANGL
MRLISLTTTSFWNPVTLILGWASVGTWVMRMDCNCGARIQGSKLKCRQDGTTHLPETGPYSAFLWQIITSTPPHPGPGQLQRAVLPVLNIGILKSFQENKLRINNLIYILLINKMSRRL